MGDPEAVFEIKTVEKTGGIKGQLKNISGQNTWRLRCTHCTCNKQCGCNGSSTATPAGQPGHVVDPESLNLKLEDIPSAPDVANVIAKALMGDETEYIMPLPSAALLPLQLCSDLTSLTVSGPQITDLDFVTGLPRLAELSVDKCQIRDLSPLATLPALRVLSITNLDLGGGGEIDLTPLSGIATLEEVCFKASSAVANIAALVPIAALK